MDANDTKSFLLRCGDLCGELLRVMAIDDMPTFLTRAMDLGHAMVKTVDNYPPPTGADEGKLAYDALMEALRSFDDIMSNPDRTRAVWRRLYNTILAETPGKSITEPLPPRPQIPATQQLGRPTDAVSLDKTSPPPLPRATPPATPSDGDIAANMGPPPPAVKGEGLDELQDVQQLATQDMEAQPDLHEEAASLPSQVPTAFSSQVSQTIPSQVPTTLPFQVPATFPSQVPLSLPFQAPTALPPQVPPTLQLGGATSAVDLDKTSPPPLPRATPPAPPSDGDIAANTPPPVIKSEEPDELQDMEAEPDLREEAVSPAALSSQVSATLPSQVPTSLPSQVPTALPSQVPPMLQLEGVTSTVDLDKTSPPPLPRATPPATPSDGDIAANMDFTPGFVNDDGDVELPVIPDEGNEHPGLDEQSPRKSVRLHGMARQLTARDTEEEDVIASSLLPTQKMISTSDEEKFLPAGINASPCDFCIQHNKECYACRGPKIAVCVFCHQRKVLCSLAKGKRGGKVRTEQQTRKRSKQRISRKQSNADGSLDTAACPSALGGSQLPLNQPPPLDGAAVKALGMDRIESLLQAQTSAFESVVRVCQEVREDRSRCFAELNLFRITLEKLMQAGAWKGRSYYSSAHTSTDRPLFAFGGSSMPSAPLRPPLMYQSPAPFKVNLTRSPDSIFVKEPIKDSITRIPSQAFELFPRSVEASPEPSHTSTAACLPPSTLSSETPLASACGITDVPTLPSSSAGLSSAYESNFILNLPSNEAYSSSPTTLSPKVKPSTLSPASPRQVGRTLPSAGQHHVEQRPKSPALSGVEAAEPASPFNAPTMHNPPLEQSHDDIDAGKLGKRPSSPQPSSRSSKRLRQS